MFKVALKLWVATGQWEAPGEPVGPEKHQVINICLKTEKGSTVLMDKQDRF